MIDRTTQAEIDLIVQISQQSGDRFAVEEERGIRDPRTGRFIKHDDYGADDKLNVRFTTEPVLNKRKTYEASGVPCYEDMDFITITVPGNKDLMVHSPVTDFYQWRFPLEYEAFKKGQTELVSGTPLDLWPALTESQKIELKHQGIRTIEQIATLADANSGVMRGFYALKAKAQQFLDDARDKTATAAVRQQLEEAEARHKAELQAMEDRFAALEAALLKKEKSKPSE